jgi:hypothetical protein
MTTTPLQRHSTSALVTYEPNARGKLVARMLCSDASSVQWLGQFDTHKEVEAEAKKRVDTITFVSPYRFAKEASCLTS